MKRFIFSLVSLSFVFLAFFIFPSTVHASGLVNPANNLGLKGYWSFNDGTSTTATDFSGNWNTGALINGPTWIGGKRGKALLFDGNNDYVEATTTMNLNSAGTVAAWFNTSFLDGNSRCVVCKMDVTSDINGFAIAVRDSVGFTWELGSATNVDFTSGFGGPLSLNKWYHVVLTWNGSDVYFYLDGVEIDHKAQTITPITTVYPVHVGADHAGSRNFQGMIDDVRIYNRALSQAEVTNLFSNGSTQIGSSLNNFMTNGLVGLWSFDGQDLRNTTAYDRSGQGNNGVLSGGPFAVRGKVGQGLLFDGVNDGVSVQSNALFIASSTAISAWVKRTSAAGEQTVMRVGGYAVGFVDGNVRWQDTLGYALTSGTVTSSSTHNDTTAWHHYAWVSDQTHLRIYYDGAEVFATPGVIATAGISPVIGNTNSRYMNGILDDVRFYNRTLSAAEVNQLYRAGNAQISTSIAGVLSSNLVLWHTFDGQKLNTITSTDSSSQGNNGTLNGGPTPTRGKIGQALSFDGVDDYVDIGSVADDIASGDATVSAWVRFPAGYNTGSACASVFRHGDNPSDNDLTLLFGNWTLFSAGAGKLGFAAYDGAFRVASSSQSSWEAGRWYHVVGTVVSGNGGPVKLYVDGSLVDTASMTGARGSTPSTHTYLRINFGSASPCQLNNEDLDDVRVYNRALSAAEVLQLYNAGK